MGYKIKALFENNTLKNEIPTTSGIYIVRVPSDMTVSFTNIPDGRAKEIKNIYNDVIEHWKGLNDKCADTSIIYYGRAKNLRRRIMQYVYYGYAYKQYNNHKGGRAIWYIKDNKNLEFEYYETRDYEGEEASLIEKYELKYGYKPLANAISGKGIN